jgi:hypothetical protein
LPAVSRSASDQEPQTNQRARMMNSSGPAAFDKFGAVRVGYGRDGAVPGTTIGPVGGGGTFGCDSALAAFASMRLPSGP